MQISAALKLIALATWLASFSEVEFKEKKSRCLMLTSSTKLEMRHFHILVVQLQQRNVQKKGVACAKMSFC